MRGFPHSSVGKESACSAGDPSLIPGSGRSTGEGIGYPLQYSWASLMAHLVKNSPATFLHCWWECKLVQPLQRTVWRFLKKLEIKLPYDPAIPLLGIHTEETRIERDTPMFITALFIIARTWKQPRCPLTDE